MNWILFGIISGSIILVCAVFSKNIKELPDISDGIYRILFFVFLCVFSLLLLYKVSGNPIPYHVDEAGMAYDAKSFVSGGTDRWGYHFPVYLINYGGGQSALYMYLAAAAIKLFGYSVFAVRLPAVICSLLSAAVFALLVRREYGKFASLISLCIFCFLPFSIMHSRWGLDAYLLFPMLIFSCSAFYAAVKSGKARQFVPAGCLFGVTFYSYAVSYILVPVFLGLVLLFLLLKHKITFKQTAALLIPVVLLAIPVILLLAVNNGLLDEIRTPYFSVPKLFAYRGSEFSFGNILQNLKIGEKNIFYNIFVWDSLVYNILPKFGSLYYFTIPLLILGFFLCMRYSLEDIKKGTLTLNLLVSILFVTAFGIQLLLPYSNVNRACALYFPLIYFLVIGFIRIIRKSRIAAILFCGFFAFFALTFVRYYCTKFPRDLAQELSITDVADLERALAFADEKNQNNEPLTIYGLSQPYLYTLLVKEIDPESFRSSVEMEEGNVLSFGKYRFDVEEVSGDRIYLLRSNGWVPFGLRDNAFVTEDFGTVTVYYNGR